MATTKPQRGWSKRQIIAIHRYATAAGLIKGQDKTAYIQFLRDHTFLGRPGFKTGAMTSKDARLTQEDFDAVMPRLEAILWQQVDAGEAVPPAETAGKPYARDYWASHCATPSRQLYAVQILFLALQKSVPAMGPSYLDGIAAKATGGRVSAWQTADRDQLALIINALEDRLRHIRRQAV